MATSNAPTTSPDPAAYTTALYSIWTVQDSLLQYYRTMFVTAESLLIAVSATIATSSGSSRHQFAGLLIAVGLLLEWVWIIVTRSRAQDVHFIQELIKGSEQGKYVNAPFTTFKGYQNASRKHRAYTIDYACNVSEDYKPRAVWPPTEVPSWRLWQWGTRIHMEVTLPIAYFIGWCGIGIYAYLS